MKTVPLTPIPNQTISFNADDAYWELHVYQAVSRMYMDISRDGVLLIRGVRCFGGVGLLPYKHLYAPDFGNFVFDNDADWNLFGGDCTLNYLSAGEYQEYLRLQVA